MSITGQETSSAVVALNGAKLAEPCVEVRKARSTNGTGDLVFDRWCYKHHHWLNAAPPQRTVVDEIEDDMRRWQESRRG